MGVGVPTKVDVLELKKEHIGRIREKTLKSLPIETCAVMIGRFREKIGKAKENRAIVKDVIFLKNTVSSAVRFAVDPDELYRTYLKAEEQAMDVVGIFHSHPAPPYPSDIDEFYMKVNPVPWLIAGIFGDRGELRAFQWNKGGIKKVKLEINKEDEPKQILRPKGSSD